MKRSWLKRKSKSPQKKIESELWKHCRRIVKKQSKDEFREIDCYTCPAKGLQGANCQLGHVPWPKSTLGAFLKYDLRVLKFQCFRCNINKGGMGAVAYERMEREMGKKAFNKLKKDKQVSVKASDHYQQLLSKYKEL